MSTIKVNSLDLGNAGTIDTYGLYNGETVDDELIEEYNQAHYTQYDYDDFEWDYNHEQIVKDLAELRAQALTDDVDVIQSVKVLETGSPREYNFTTDWADFEIKYNEDAVNKYIEENQEDYDKWYRDSGWYAATEWMDADDNRRERQIRNSKLDYCLNHKIYKEFNDWYYPVAEHEWEVYMNNTKMELKKK